MEGSYFEIVKTAVLQRLQSEEYQAAYRRTEQGRVDESHAVEVVELSEQLWNEREDTAPPEALRIAALTHDSDRFYPDREVDTKDCPPELYDYRKGIHAGTTALIFFEQYHPSLPVELVHDVCFLILRHERGGDRAADGTLHEQKDAFTDSFNLHRAANYLCYADKLSFFTSNIHEYKKRGKERLREKIVFSLRDLPPFVREKIFDIDYADPVIQDVLDSLPQSD